MIPYQPTYSRSISRGPFTLRERNGRWIMSCPWGDVPAGQDEYDAIDLMEELARDFNVCRVYFIGEVAEMGRPVKIGFTRNPDNRLMQLQASSPYHLHILAMGVGDVTHEGAYHRAFAAQRSHGEWFIADSAILAEIERLRAGARAGRYLDAELPLAPEEGRIL